MAGGVGGRLSPQVRYTQGVISIVFRKFSTILVDIFGVLYAGKIPHLASFARHQRGDCQYVAEIPCLGYLTHLGFVHLGERILAEFVAAYDPTAICDDRCHSSVPLVGYCHLSLIYII